MESEFSIRCIASLIGSNITYGTQIFVLSSQREAEPSVGRAAEQRGRAHAPPGQALCGGAHARALHEQAVPVVRRALRRSPVASATRQEAARRRQRRRRLPRDPGIARLPKRGPDQRSWPIFDRLQAPPQPRPHGRAQHRDELRAARA